MKTAATTRVTVTVFRHNDGELMGTAQVIWSDYLADGADADGLVIAGHHMTRDDLLATGLDAEETVWFQS